MKRVRIDYTVYSPDHKSEWNLEKGRQETHGECWDAISMRNAKRLAKRFGAGSMIVRNFNQNEISSWTQADRCWVWDGRELYKASSLAEKKWVVPKIPRAISVLRKKISRNH